MATADLTVIALGRPDASASEYVAEIQRRLRAQDRVRFQMHAMGTSLEGSTEDILRVVGELHAVPFELGVPRVYTVLKLDERREHPAATARRGEHGPFPPDLDAYPPTRHPPSLNRAILRRHGHRRPHRHQPRPP